MPSVAHHDDDFIVGTKSQAEALRRAARAGRVTAGSRRCLPESAFGRGEDVGGRVL